MKIKEIGRVITGKTPSTKNIDNFEGEINFITPEDIAKGYIIKATNRHISEKGYNSIKSNTLDGISVLVGCIGSDMGNVAISVGKCASNQQINAITDIADDWNPFYIYYYLSKKKKYFHQIAGTTTTPILPKSVFEEISIPYVRREVQDKISNILKSLDDKIVNNNMIIEELESMAKTIYDYWFLQFEFPNEEGKPYKSSGGKMVWNEEVKKEIPEGWKVVDLKDAVSITMGTSPKGDSISTKNEGIVFYQGKADFGYRFPATRVYTNSPIRYAEEKDVLLSVRAPVGALNIASEKCCIGRGLAALHSEYSSFMFYLMLANQYKFDTYNHAGTTFGAITKDDLFRMRVTIPGEPIIGKFEEKVSYIDKKIYKNNNENKELISLRDFLLPLLMNGQVGFKK